MKKGKFYGEGPYNRCLNCDFLGNGCDGPRTSCMPLERWCGWCRDLKEIRGYSNAYISEHSGVSENTISRIMAGKATQDIMRDTAARIEAVLVGSSRKWPCAMELNKDKEIVYMDSPQTLEMLADRATQIDRLRKNYDDLASSLDKEVQAVRNEYQAKIDYLKKQVEGYAEQNAHLNKIITKLMEL